MTEKLQQIPGMEQRLPCTEENEPKRRCRRIATWWVIRQGGAIKAWLCPDHVREYREKLAEKGGAR